MSEFFATGHAVDVVLAVMAIEVIWLVSRSRPMATILLTIAPGAAMMLGLRAALVGAAWYWVAGALAVSLPLHLADLRHRRLV